MRAPRLSLFKRDKYLFIGIHAGLTTAELAILLVLLSTEAGELEHRSSLWSRLFGPDESPYGGTPYGPLLPWSRQGVTKALHALIERGWVEEVRTSAWAASRDQGLRLLPVVIESCMPKWLPEFLGKCAPKSAPAMTEKECPVSEALDAAERPLQAKQRELRATSAPATGVSLPAAAKRSTKVAAAPMPDLASRRRALRQTTNGKWAIRVEPRRKPKVHRVQDCKHWTARFLGVGGTWAHRIQVAETPAKAVEALVKWFADANAEAMVASRVNDVALWFPVTDPKQVSVAFQGRGQSDEWNKFPKSETWQVKLRAAGKRGA